jgi:excinuclease ABC subunit B
VVSLLTVEGMDVETKLSSKELSKFRSEEDVYKEIAKLEKEMWEAANNWEFEKAAKIRDRIEELKKLVGL